MYLNYFGLVERPFSIAPDPQYLYMSSRHREAMAHLSYGLQQGGCFIVLTGEVGTGKTTLCRNLLADLPDNVDVALIINPNINRRELLETVCDELKVGCAERDSKKKMLDAINQHLLETYAQNRHTVLIIDEAQLLSRGVLEQVRLLTNLETTKAKLLQIILIGQPELSDVLSRNDLRQLAQRVTARYHLPAIGQGDIQDYVNFRLGVAGCRKPLFTAQALKALYKLSGGIPRKINVLADHALLSAYANSEVMVESKTVKQSAKDVFIKPTSADQANAVNQVLHWALPLAVLLLVNVGLWWWFTMDDDGHVQQSAATQSSTQNNAAFSAQSSKEGSTEHSGGSRTQTHTQTISTSSAESTNANELVADNGLSPSKEGLAEGLTTIVKTDHVSPGSVVISDEFLDDEPDDQSQVVEPAPPAYLADSAFGRVLDVSPDRTGRILAFRNLAAAWDIDLPENLLGSLCDEIERQAATCLTVSSWSAMLRYNRPSIMTLQHNAVEHRVILYKLDDAIARVLVGEQTHELPVSELRDRWVNTATVFWRPSDLGAELRQQGDVSTSLPQLRVTLNTLFEQLGMPALGNVESDVFDSDLSIKVAQLQQRFGLLTDGKVGRETYLLINELLNAENVPVLIQRIPSIKQAPVDHANTEQ